MDQIILVFGVKGSGKDFFVEKYKKELEELPIANTFKEQVIVLKFADPLTKLFSDIYGINLSDKILYEDWKLENRHLLQNAGTSLKNIFGKDIFGKYVEAQIRKYLSINKDKFTTFIITDLRFLDELQPILLLAEIPIKFYFTNYRSPKYSLDDSHESEKLAQAWAKANKKEGFYTYAEFMQINSELKLTE